MTTEKANYALHNISGLLAEARAAADIAPPVALTDGDDEPEAQAEPDPELNAKWVSKLNADIEQRTAALADIEKRINDARGVLRLAVEKIDALTVNEASDQAHTDASCALDGLECLLSAIQDVADLAGRGGK